MALYCYIDLDTGDHFESTEYGLEKRENVKRDYASEGVNVGPAVGAINRDMKSSDTRDLFLPTRKDFEKKHGHKGEGAVDAAVKTWNETHENPTPGSGKYRPK